MMERFKLELREPIADGSRYANQWLAIYRDNFDRTTYLAMPAVNDGFIALTLTELDSFCGRAQAWIRQERLREAGYDEKRQPRAREVSGPVAENEGVGREGVDLPGGPEGDRGDDTRQPAETETLMIANALHKDPTLQVWRRC